MTDRRAFTEIERAMWKYLKAHCVGRRNATRQLDLGRAIGIEGADHSITRRVQQIAKALRDELGLPVCASSRTVTITVNGREVTCPPGVYIPETMAEAEESLQNMFSRGWETIRSGRRLRSAVRRFCGDQRPLLVEAGPGACTEALRVGEAGFCGWCGDLFEATKAGQEFCTDKSPMCRDQFWSEARRIGAEELRNRRAS